MLCFNKKVIFVGLTKHKLTMNKNQINRKERNDVVVIYLDDNILKWSSIPKVGEFKNEFESINTQIEAAQEAQHDAQVKLGKNKKQFKRMIAEKADILNDAVEAFAAVTDNPELENKMDTTASQLNHLKNEDFVVSIKEVVTEATNHKDVLIAEYGVTDAQITDVQTDLNGFQKILGKPRAYQIASIQATKDLVSLFKESDHVLNTKLDKVIKIFKRRDTNFYNGYLAARAIVDN